jgi:hypothetical protein
MKVNIYEVKNVNSGILEKNDEVIEIKSGRWIDKFGVSHPMNFVKKECFDDKFVYWVSLLGDESTTHGKHISLTFFQKQKFLWLQNSHWFQKEENIRYLINILFLIYGIIIGILQ